MNSVTLDNKESSLATYSTTTSPISKGLRFNEGKTRYDLLHPYAIEKLAEVFTRGAQKYSARNWEEGMNWTTIIASLKRHLAALERGEDYDQETGLLHSAHVEWNAHVLTAYYKIYPQGDDRAHKFLRPKRIGLDIDGILGDFIGHLMSISGNAGHIPIHWNDPIIIRELDIRKKDSDFWAGIPPLLNRDDIPFEPVVYVTARSIDKEVTQGWLDKNMFPKAPLFSIGHGESKVDVLKKANVDIFVDDSYTNFVELNNAGIFTYLYDAPYNRKYDVGFRRIHSLKELA